MARKDSGCLCSDDTSLPLPSYISHTYLHTKIPVSGSLNLPGSPRPHFPLRATIYTPMVFSQRLFRTLHSIYYLYCNILYVALPVNFVVDFLLTIDKEAALDSSYRLMDLHFLFHFCCFCFSFPQFHVSIGSSTSPNLIFRQSDALKCSFVFLLHSGVVEVVVDMGYVVHKMKMVREDVLFPQQLGNFCRSYRFRIAKIWNLG